MSATIAGPGPGPTAVTSERRVKRLEQQGVISGSHAHVDPVAAGRPFKVTVSVEVIMNDQRSLEDFESALAAMPETVEAREVFGSPDYIL